MNALVENAASLLDMWLQQQITTDRFIMVGWRGGYRYDGEGDDGEKGGRQREGEEGKTMTITRTLTDMRVTESLIMPGIVLSIAHIWLNLIQ